MQRENEARMVVLRMKTCLEQSLVMAAAVPRQLRQAVPWVAKRARSAPASAKRKILSTALGGKSGILKAVIQFPVVT